MSLQTQEFHVSLGGGFIQEEPFRKEGTRSTLYAVFKNPQSRVSARLQHSADGNGWADIDESAVGIKPGPVYIQAWTENVLPEGTMLRMVVEPADAFLLHIKYLSA